MSELEDLRPLTEIEREVLIVVCQAFHEVWENPTALWVRWQVRHRFERSLTAIELCQVVRSMPSFGPPKLKRRYGPIQLGASVGDESHLQLTALGAALSGSPSAELAEDFAMAVAHFGRRAKHDPPPVAEFKPMQGQLDEIKALFSYPRSRSLPELVARRVARLLDQEPNGLIMGGSHAPNYTSWEKPVLHDAEAFADVASFDDYLARLRVFLASPPQVRGERTPSPLELHASIDYLNAVWKNAAPKLDAAQVNPFSPPICRGCRKTGLRMRQRRRTGVTSERSRAGSEDLPAKRYVASERSTPAPLASRSSVVRAGFVGLSC